MAAVAAAALWLMTSARLPLEAERPMQVVMVAFAALMLFQAKRTARFAGLFVFVLVLTGLWQPGQRRMTSVRSFFGVHQVLEIADGSHRLLLHGTTIHGAERIRAMQGQALPARPEPLTYYYFGGPYLRRSRPHAARKGISSMSRPSDSYRQSRLSSARR